MILSPQPISANSVLDADNRLLHVAEIPARTRVMVLLIKNPLTGELSAVESTLLLKGSSVGGNQLTPEQVAAVQASDAPSSENAFITETEFSRLTTNALSLEEAQRLLALTPASLVPNRLDAITGAWNDLSTPTTVYVHVVRPDAYHKLGIVYDSERVPQLVVVNVKLGTYEVLEGGVGGAPQWVAGVPLKKFQFVYNEGKVFLVREDIRNPQSGPTSTNRYYLEIGAGTPAPTVDLLGLTNEQMLEVMSLSFDANNESTVAAAPEWSRFGMSFDGEDENGDAWHYYVGRGTFKPYTGNIDTAGEDPQWSRLSLSGAGVSNKVDLLDLTNEQMQAVIGLPFDSNNESAVGAAPEWSRFGMSFDSEDENGDAWHYYVGRGTFKPYTGNTETEGEDPRWSRLSLSGAGVSNKVDLLGLSNEQMLQVMTLVFDDDNDSVQGTAPEWSRFGMSFDGEDEQGDAWHYYVGRGTFKPYTQNADGEGEDPRWSRVTKIKP